MKKQPQEDKSTNEFTNVDDIHNDLLYTKDGYMFGYLRVYTANIELLTRETLKAKTNQMISNVQGEYIRQAYLAIPREVDIDTQKRYMEQKYMEELTSSKRKQVLGLMLDHAIQLGNAHENFEHQHVIKFWSQVGTRDKYLKEKELKAKLEDWKSYYQGIEIKTEIIDSKEILKMCNLFSNGVQAIHEQIDDLHYTPHTFIKPT